MDLPRSECLLAKDDGSDGRMPADMGVGGLGGSGDFISGRGREDVLSRASRAFKSRCLMGPLGPSIAGEVTVDPEDDVGRERGRFDLCWLSSGDPLGSGALVTRPLSLIVRRGLFTPVTETVCALDIFGWFVVSDITSSIGCGLRACATAIGPAARTRPGTATLASTKLANMVTGNAFSLIFSCLAASPNPKTICWTLL